MCSWLMNRTDRSIKDLVHPEQRLTIPRITLRPSIIINIINSHSIYRIYQQLYLILRKLSV
jgi:hypothetical protein